MMLAGLPVADDAIDELAARVRAIGADDLADRLERALGDGVKLIALTIRRARDSSWPRSKTGRTGSRSCDAVLLNEHPWRQGEGDS